MAHILYVENDDSLRRKIAWKLEDKGHQVDAVGGSLATGETAYEAALKKTDHHTSYDMLLTNDDIGGGGGVLLMKEIHKRIPSIGLILTSPDSLGQVMANSPTQNFPPFQFVQAKNLGYLDNYADRINVKVFQALGDKAPGPNSAGQGF